MGGAAFFFPPKSRDTEGVGCITSCAPPPPDAKTGKTLRGNSALGSQEGCRRFSVRRAPLACCSVLLSWTQPGRRAPGWDVTKLVSTFLLPHPHPYFVIPVLALRAEWPSGRLESEMVWG